MLLKQTGIKISNKQQINSDQNFRALFGKKGQKRLNDLFNPCCSTVKFISLCVTYNGVKTPLCAVPFPICTTVTTDTKPTSPPSPTVVQFSSIETLLAAISIFWHRTIYTDGCNIVIVGKPDDTFNLDYPDCLSLVSCSSFSSGDIVEPLITLTDFTIEDGSPEDFHQVSFTWDNLPSDPITLTVETSIDGVNWFSEGTVDTTGQSGSLAFDFPITATPGATLYARVKSLVYGVVSNILSVIIP